MASDRLTLQLLPQTLAIARLDPSADFPEWAWRSSGLVSIARTGEELSVVCEQDAVPNGTPAERGWRAIRVLGTLDLELTGVLASLAFPLAEAAVPIFAVSTYDTDYLLVREEELARASEALLAAGHSLV